MKPRSLVLASALVITGATLLLPASAQAECVDEALKEQLVGRRAYRGVVPRLFQKSLRHEISPMGGWFAADLSDGAPMYGGAYTFHFSEELGLEASYFRTQRSFEFLEAVGATNPSLVDFVNEETAPIQLFMGNLVWSLAYGKVRWLGGAISRFDFYVALGAGATDAPGSVGVTGSGGFGMKFFLAEWLALRLDVRDLVHAQRAPLGEDKVVNDIAALGGLSVFLPFTN
ncbi:MAG: outer membrane beta-barrel domain-containing protein [Polyangiaceae bacterium]|nr:outer membrane beta-barrel domain-containing protein [Polyangiaceae bacterium]MCW5789042.1 outer membrane beta-barrel domain-containing protein [Polyangiaceae bacterium]